MLSMSQLQGFNAGGPRTQYCVNYGQSPAEADWRDSTSSACVDGVIAAYAGSKYGVDDGSGHCVVHNGDTTVYTSWAYYSRVVG